MKRQVEGATSGNTGTTQHNSFGGIFFERIQVHPCCCVLCYITLQSSTGTAARTDGHPPSTPHDTHRLLPVAQSLQQRRDPFLDDDLVRRFFGVNPFSRNRFPKLRRGFRSRRFLARHRRSVHAPRCNRGFSIALQQGPPQGTSGTALLVERTVRANFFSCGTTHALLTSFVQVKTKAQRGTDSV